MKTVAMCFSLLQFPRCKFYAVASFWRGCSYNLGRTGEKVLCSSSHELGGGYSRRWTRRSITTGTGETNKKLTENSSIRHDILPPTTGNRKSRTINVRKEIVSVNTKLTACAIEATEIESDQYYVDLAKLATIICFDIETTGFHRERDRIIEIALQDLRGGENSTFQTLVNPERDVPNTDIHGISAKMVRRSCVPRMKDLIPILLNYIQSRQLPGGIIVLVSHNGRTFDVPFLKNEFSRCSYEIPSYWHFADTMPLARAVMKSNGLKVPSRISLQALRDHYAIPLIGPAHRALSDVHSLSLVLQRLTYDLKLPVSDLIKGSFK